MYIIHCKMKGVLPVVMTRNTFFFVLLSTLFRGVKPLNRCFAPSSFINDVMSQRAFAGTCRSTLVVQDMVAGYEPSVATVKCPVDCFTTYVAVCSYARECVKGLYCF